MEQQTRFLSLSWQTYLASTGNLRDSNDSPYIYSDAAQQHPGSVQKEYELF